MGLTDVRLYDNLTFTEQEDKEDTTLIIRKIDAAIQGEVNETYERHVFNRRNQGTEESFDSYLAEIRNLAKSCNFCDCMSDSLIRDRIVMGVYDAGTRKHLLQKRQLTLQAAMDICHSDEAATAQMKSINDSAEIHKIKKSHSGDADRQNSTWKPGNLRSQRTMQRRQNATYSDGDTKRTCKFCGRAHPQKKVCCLAWGRTCRRCGGRNHFSNCCKMGNKKVHTVDRCGRTDEESIMALDKGRYTKGRIYAEMWMNDKSVKFQIDSGATMNVLPKKYVSKDDIHPSDVTLHMWNRTTREVIGKTLATLVNPVNQTSSVRSSRRKLYSSSGSTCSRKDGTNNSEL